MRRAFIIPVITYLVCVTFGWIRMDYSLLQILVAMWAASCLHDMAASGEKVRATKTKTEERTESVEQ